MCFNGPTTKQKQEKNQEFFKIYKNIMKNGKINKQKT